MITLRSNKSPGPDGIPLRITKDLKFKLNLLAKICNLLQKSAFLPEDWKVSKIILKFKKKIHDPDQRNYRPVSLTYTLSKVIGRLINPRIVSLNNNKPISYLFEGGVSTFTAYF